MGDLIETTGERPVIAVTLGDPAGIGPEVVLKALADPTIAPLAAWRSSAIATSSSAPARRAAFRSFAARRDRCVTSTRCTAAGRCRAGSTPRCGRAAVAYVREATDMCLRREAIAMVTAPVSKEAVALSGHAVLRPHRVHRRTLRRHRFAHDAHQPAPLRRPRHDAHARCARRSTCGRSASRARSCSPPRRCAGWATTTPRIAVCGMNPHASEHGLFGGEEHNAISPGDRSGARARRRVPRAVRAGHDLSRRVAGQMGRGDRDVSRSGPHPDEAARLRRTPST